MDEYASTANMITHNATNANAKEITLAIMHQTYRCDYS